ncbi:hypothetical protein ACWFMI_24010 [Nocardiopsis terrae]|uniref:hypothetical protein n=1 Tax=Streptomyces sp. NPDC057554 TaxID=3350538 RepID=UPI0036AB1EFA
MKLLIAALAGVLLIAVASGLAILLIILLIILRRIQNRLDHLTAAAIVNRATTRPHPTPQPPQARRSQFRLIRGGAALILAVSIGSFIYDKLTGLGTRTALIAAGSSALLFGSGANAIEEVDQSSPISLPVVIQDIDQDRHPPQTDDPPAPPSDTVTPSTDLPPQDDHTHSYSPKSHAAAEPPPASPPPEPTTEDDKQCRFELRLLNFTLCR